MRETGPIMRYALTVAGLVGGWKLLSWGLSANVLPPPEQAFAAFGLAVKEGMFWRHLGASAFRVGAAMALAWTVAFPTGVLLGFHQRADKLLSPAVFLTYPIPKIVLLPIFLIIFGLGDISKVFMISLIIGYQVLVATRDSVAGLDRKYVDSLRSLGGSGLDVIRHVVMPAALPGGFTALRIGTGTGIAVLFFVESFATDRGLGFLIMDSWGRFAYEQMFVGIMGMSLLGVIIYEVFNYLERILCTWKYLESGRNRLVCTQEGGLGDAVAVFGRMVKFSHTVFALPFALSAVVLAQREHQITPGLIFWILVAMVGARSAAMGFNRIVDRTYDRENPRTANRALPAGEISFIQASLFVAGFSALFLLSAAMISKLCFILAFPVLMILFSYSYTKRFTVFSHLYLGFAISLAPVGAWIAVTGDLDPGILVLSGALLAYIAGFDILYACQDLDYDRRAGLLSIPARFGIRTAFFMSSLLHLAAIVCLFLLMVIFDLGPVYLGALGVIGALLAAEHRIVRPYDLERIHVAFFHVNSAVSVVLFLGVLCDEVARRAAG
ncbi:MAG: UbiA-like polyprenyltransferase [Desulfobacteraceae bacterium]